MESKIVRSQLPTFLSGINQVHFMSSLTICDVEELESKLTVFK